MKSSELIEEIQKQIDSNGDIDVEFYAYEISEFVAIDDIVIAEGKNGKIIGLE